MNFTVRLKRVKGSVDLGRHQSECTMFSLTVLALALVLGSAGGSPCRADWVYFGDSCYAFGEIAASWPDASDYCRSANSKLAEIESSSENEFLKNQSRQRNGGSYWLGGTDIFHEGVWTWMSTGELVNFNDWFPGEPDDNSAHQDCMILWSQHDYQWDDSQCENKFEFICESPPEETIVG